MGNQMGKKQSINLMDTNQWTTIDQPTSTLFSNINSYRSRLLFNNISHDYIEQYILYFSSEEQFLNYVSQLQWRKHSNKNFATQIPYAPPTSLYPVRYFQNTSNSQLCNTTHSGKVYFDRIEMRLKEINEIPIMDSYYMLKTTLEGFKILYEKYGDFRIRQEFIFITREGEVKVWISDNLSNIQVNEEDRINCGERNMVMTLIHLIESNIDSEDFTNLKNKKFSQFLLQQTHGVGPSLRKQINLTNATFSNAIEYLHNFVQIEGITIGDRMESVYELYHSHTTYGLNEIVEENDNKTQKSNSFSYHKYGHTGYYKSAQDSGYATPIIKQSRYKHIDQRNPSQNQKPIYKIKQSHLQSSQLKITQANEQQRMLMQLYRTSRTGQESRPKSYITQTIPQKIMIDQSRRSNRTKLMKMKEKKQPYNRFNTQFTGHHQQNRNIQPIRSPNHQYFSTQYDKKQLTPLHTPTITIPNPKQQRILHDYYGNHLNIQKYSQRGRQQVKKIVSADPKTLIGRMGSCSKYQYQPVKNNAIQSVGRQQMLAVETNQRTHRIKFRYNNIAQDNATPRLSNVPSTNKISLVPYGQICGPLSKQDTPLSHKSRRSDYQSFKYYTTNESYELDEEIAEDLEKILGHQIVL